MTRALLACAAALLVASAAAHAGHDHSHGEEAAHSAALEILGDDNFDAKVGAGGTWLVKFYGERAGSRRVPRLAPASPRRRRAAARSRSRERVRALSACARAERSPLWPSGFPPPFLSGAPCAAPWCGHCKRLAPTWDELATTLAAEGSSAHVGKVDCTVHQSVCQKYEVRGYPTLLGFKDGAISGGDAIKYPGGRDLTSLKSWVTQNTPAAAAADL